MSVALPAQQENPRENQAGEKVGNGVFYRCSAIELPEFSRREGLEPPPHGLCEVSVTCATGHDAVASASAFTHTHCFPVAGEWSKRARNLCLRCPVQRGYASAPQVTHSGRVSALLVHLEEVTLLCRHRRLLTQKVLRQSSAPALRLTGRSAKLRHKSAKSHPREQTKRALAIWSRSIRLLRHSGAKRLSERLQGLPRTLRPGPGSAEYRQIARRSCATAQKQPENRCVCALRRRQTPAGLLEIEGPHPATGRDDERLSWSTH